MKKFSNATFVSGATVGIVGGLFFAANELIFFNSGMSFLFAGAVGLFMYTLLGLLFSSILLIPLKPLFHKFSHLFSCVIFLITGFTIPLLLQYWLNQFHAHGIDPYSAEEISGTVVRMIVICSIGAMGAFSAWFTLLKENRANGS